MKPKDTQVIVRVDRAYVAGPDLSTARANELNWLAKHFDLMRHPMVEAHEKRQAGHRYNILTDEWEPPPAPPDAVPPCWKLPWKGHHPSSRWSFARWPSRWSASTGWMTVFENRKQPKSGE